ncbi:YafY family protein [Burkholderia sp. S171]|uniref:helix-turn-helix transcriptional regulator n=1 Tax=Burkholderia sp. S171 TaxID=1641860 RepID=UPI0020B14EAE|nr:WYL domain-containing protein [Burkholderia sp. S171]
MPVIKTVQRRLERMCDEGLVEQDKRGVALHWRKRAGASGMAAKAGSMMTRDEALALQTLKRFSSRQIPVLVAEHLSAMFHVAQHRLEIVHSEDDRRYLKWADKVAVESGAFTLKYPVVDGAIFSAVSQALFYERKLEIVYRPRNKINNEEAKVILPLGLVEVGGLVYLIGGTEGRPNPTMYRLDRLWRAAMMLESFAYPKSFQLANYVRQQRQFDFMVEGEILLKLRFSHGAGDHLLETPFADDQKDERADERLEVQGTTLLSQRLRWWLRSFGPTVEVLEPASLRAELASEAHVLAAMYRK